VKFISKQGGTNNEENNVECVSGSVSAFLFHGGIAEEKLEKIKASETAVVLIEFQNEMLKPGGKEL